MKRVVIIGNGVAGITAARNIRKLSNHQITVISAESDHFFSRPALMYLFMGHMKFKHLKPYEDHFWSKNRINLVRGYVNRIQFEEKSVSLKDGKQINYDDLILATGSVSNMLDVPGNNLSGVLTLYHLKDLERLENQVKTSKKAVVVGGGLIGIELAEMLQSRNLDVTMLVRESGYYGNVLSAPESQLINNHILKHGIDLHLNQELDTIEGDTGGRVKSITTKSGKSFPCDMVGITVGVSPNINLVQNTKLKTNYGILVDKFLETNIENVYAVGDCAELVAPKNNRKSIEPIWYTGQIMGETVARSVCGNLTEYDPGIWFNSAKFFDIEYQTYGYLPSETGPELEDFFWRHRSKEQSLRFVFSKEDSTIKGVNALGIRLRQEVFHQWIREKVRIEEVIGNLEMANFQPEFSGDFVKQVQAEFLSQFPGRTIHTESKNDLVTSLET